ncbi:hypothetical protein FUMI01_18260 [Flavobacterium sp. UMI-01]|nr:hypothetical protein FUMI01_18260 [Flavobacterium sp. UMI-01]
MNKIELLLGMLIGFSTTIVGMFLFFYFFTDYDFVTGIHIMRAQGYWGKIITLGSILNLIMFTILLKLDKDTLAKGIIFALILMTIYTIFQ